MSPEFPKYSSLTATQGGLDFVDVDVSTDVRYISTPGLYEPKTVYGSRNVNNRCSPSLESSCGYRSRR